MARLGGMRIRPETHASGLSAYAHLPTLEVSHKSLLVAYRTNTKTRVAGLGLMLALFVVLPGLYIAGGPYTEALPRLFDSNVWKSTDTWSKTRCSMLVDLRARIGVKGKARADLVELLGPEENEDKDVSVSHWHLCPSFMDVWILEVRWKDDFVVDSWVRDT